MHATSLLVLGLASAASAQLTNANDDPRLSERDNYGIGFGIGGPVLALLIGYALLRNSMRPHDLSRAFSAEVFALILLNLHFFIVFFDAKPSGNVL